MKFTTTVAGTTVTGIEVPAEVGGRYMVALSVKHREAAGVAGGDQLEVDIVLDDRPREVEVPADFAAALDAEPKARVFFDGLSYSQRSWFVLGIEEAKKPETRASRITKAVERLASGRGRR